QRPIPEGPAEGDGPIRGPERDHPGDRQAGRPRGVPGRAGGRRDGAALPPRRGEGQPRLPQGRAEREGGGGGPGRPAEDRDVNPKRERGRGRALAHASGFFISPPGPWAFAPARTAARPCPPASASRPSAWTTPARHGLAVPAS